MKLAKRFCIWLAGILVAFLLANLAGNLFIKHTGADILMPSMIGYSKKMTFPLGEIKSDDDRKLVGATLGLRGILSDTRLVNVHPTVFERLTFQDMVIDESIIFTGQEGTHELSSGIYACVYDESIEGYSLIRTIGLINVGEFVQTAGADAVCDVLAEHPDAEVRLDAYSIRDYKIEPAEITVRSADGTEYLHTEFPASGDIIRSDTCVIENEYYENGTATSLSQQLLLAKEGERESDRVAQKLLADFPFGQPNIEEQKVSYGFASITSQRCETSDEGYGMITVLRFTYWKGVLLYTCILGGIWTVIIGIMFAVRSRRERV